MCPSWRVWREPVSRCSPGDFGACGGALRAGCKGSRAAAGGGRVSGPSPELPPPPAGPFLPSPPCGVALWPRCQRFPGSGTAVFANFPGKGGGMPLSGERMVPASLQRRARAWKWRRTRGSYRGCKSMDPRLRASGGSGRRWQTPTARPLQHPEMGGRKMNAIAEEEERGKCWCPLPLSCCPGGVTHCQDCGLAQPVLGGWVVRGGALCLGEYSPPRALMGCTLLPPIRGLGL